MIMSLPNANIHHWFMIFPKFGGGEVASEKGLIHNDHYNPAKRAVIIGNCHYGDNDHYLPIMIIIVSCQNAP